MKDKELKKLLMDYYYNIKMYGNQLSCHKRVVSNIKRWNITHQDKHSPELMDMEEKIAATIIKMTEAQAEMEAMLEVLEQPYKGVMYSRYVMLFTFEEIAADLSYSVQRIYQLHRKGMDMLLAHANA